MIHANGVMDLRALPFLPLSSTPPAALTSGSFSQATQRIAMGTHISMPMKA